MAKFYGLIGFAILTEHADGVWSEDITEYNYTGDILRNTRGLQPGDYH